MTVITTLPIETKDWHYSIRRGRCNAIVDGSDFATNLLEARDGTSSQASTVSAAGAWGRVLSDTPLVTDFDSSAVERARYSPQARILEIWYKGGHRYSYFDVPPDVYSGLRGATSAGEYVNREIKPNYRCEIEQRRRRFRPD